MLATAIDSYHELVLGEHAETTRDQLVRAIERHDIYYGAIPPVLVLRPQFVDAATWDDASRAATQLARAIRIATERLLDDRALRGRIGFPSYLDPVLEIDRAHGAPTVLGRFDGLVAPGGPFRPIEFNSEPEGVHLVVELDAAIAGAPVGTAFASRFRFRRSPLFDLCLRAIRDDHETSVGRGAPVIAVVRGDASPTMKAHYRYFHHAAAHGCQVLLARPEELAYRDGALTAGDIRIDRLVFSSWQSVMTRPPEMAHLFRAITDGAVRVFHGLSRGLLASYKHTFEALSDPDHRNLFPSELHGVLARHVPWTRVVRDRKTWYRAGTVDLIRLITDNRERFVLKPSGGSGGHGVVLGWSSDRETWTRAVDRAVQQRNHVVQERAAATEADYPIWDGHAMSLVRYCSDLAPMVWNGDRVDGSVSRLAAPAGQLNVGHGASPAPVWIIDGPA